MTRPSLGALGLLAIVATVTVAQPVGFHRRIEGGFTIVTISIPTPGVTVCLLDPPVTPRMDVEGGSSVRARSLSGHLVLRADAPSLADAVAALSDVLDGSRAAAWSPDHDLSLPERHLLSLCGADVSIPTRPPRGRPLLVAAGNEDDVDLMERMVPLLDALPNARPGSVDPIPSEFPRMRWWRHLSGEPNDAVWMAWVTTGDLKAADRAALRMLFRAASVRLGKRGWPSRFQVLRTANGRVRWLRVPVAPDSIPTAVDVARSVLDELRDAPLPQAEFDAHRDVLRREDLNGLREPDRWFTDVLAADIRHELPATAFDARREWAALSPESLRERALVLLPNDVVVVSTGTLAARQLPTETWPNASAVTLPELPEEDRRSLLGDVLDRLTSIVPDSVAAFVVESEWTWLRDRASLTGRLVERFDGDRLAESFYPLDGGIGFDAWVSETDGGADLLDQPRALPIEDRVRLVGRFWSDPWHLVMHLAEHPSSDVRYGGGIQEDDEVFQLVTIEVPGVSVSVRSDPREGLPRRVTVSRSDTDRTVEYRFFDYAEWAGGRYPERIERFEGIRRTSVRQVRDIRRSARLATTDGLR